MDIDRTDPDLSLLLRRGDDAFFEYIRRRFAEIARDSGKAPREAPALTAAVLKRA